MGEITTGTRVVVLSDKLYCPTCVHNGKQRFIGEYYRVGFEDDSRDLRFCPTCRKWWTIRYVDGCGIILEARAE